MPNIVHNRLEILGEKNEVKSVREFLKKKKPDEIEGDIIDFNNIIKMPECLNIESNAGSTYPHGVLLSKSPGYDFLITGEENGNDLEAEKEAIKLAESNFEKTGFYNWYDWRNANWETKWNASSQNLDGDNIIYFDTAWNPVVKLIKILSQRFPKIEFRYTFDILGEYVTGKMIIQDGEIVKSKLKEWDLNIFR